MTAVDSQESSYGYFRERGDAVRCLLKKPENLGRLWRASKRVVKQAGQERAKVLAKDKKWPACAH